MQTPNSKSVTGNVSLHFLEHIVFKILVHDKLIIHRYILFPHIFCQPCWYFNSVTNSKLLQNVLAITSPQKRLNQITKFNWFDPSHHQEVNIFVRVVIRFVYVTLKNPAVIANNFCMLFLVVTISWIESDSSSWANQFSAIASCAVSLTNKCSLHFFQYHPQLSPPLLVKKQLRPSSNTKPIRHISRTYKKWYSN